MCVSVCLSVTTVYLIKHYVDIYSVLIMDIPMLLVEFIQYEYKFAVCISLMCKLINEPVGGN